MQPGACTHCVRTLTSLIREKTDVHLSLIHISLRHGGVNRISMGVQSAHDEELSLLNRLHTFEQAERAVGMIRKAGFKNLNLDLIFGLPDQTMEARCV